MSSTFKDFLLKEVQSEPPEPKRVKRYSVFVKTLSKTGYYTVEKDIGDITIFLIYRYKNRLE